MRFDGIKEDEISQESSENECGDFIYDLDDEDGWDEPEYDENREPTDSTDKNPLEEDDDDDWDDLEDDTSDVDNQNNLSENQGRETEPEVEQKPSPESSTQENKEDVSLKEQALKQNEISKQYYAEYKDSMKPFEQNEWDNLSMDEKKEAVDNLRDSVAEDLGLSEKPDIRYYNNTDEGDFGGYLPSENAIYLNEHNMGDASETADTIAHESRHCWQYERAENPQNERDNEFKENFEDYIRPEDDYRGYKNQPIEQDARDYAKDITGNIPRGDKSEGSNIDNLSDNKTADHIRKDAQEKGAVFDKSSLPEDINNKKTSFESKVREPEEYDSKYDYDNQKKLEDYYKQGDGKLTDEQKTALTDELKTNYDAVPKEVRGDVLVPENEKDVSYVYYNENTQKYDVGYNWKNVDTVPESREMKIMQVGDQFDRVGPPTGKCVGEVNSDGSCATREQRSIPYHFNEANITDEPSYHRYEAEQDFTKENLDNAIDYSFYSDAQKAEMHQKVDDYYDRSHAKYGDGDGLAYGKIAPMFEDTTGSTGGGYQYGMPLSMDELENIGMISEVSRGRY